MRPARAYVGDRWRDTWMHRLENVRPPLADWMARMERDAFWKHGSVCENYDDIQCAVYAVTGWTDGYSEPVLRLMQNLNVPRKGMIGSWTHMHPNWGKPGPEMGVLQECMRWWKHWLLEEDTGIMDEPMLRLWVGKDFEPHPRYPKIGGRWMASSRLAARGQAARILPRRSQSRAATPVSGTGPLRIDTPLHLGAQAGEWCPLRRRRRRAEFQGDNRADDGLSVCFDTPVLTEKGRGRRLSAPQARSRHGREKATVIVRLNEVVPDGTSGRITYAIRRIKRPAGVASRRALQLRDPAQGRGLRVRAGQPDTPRALDHLLADGVARAQAGRHHHLPDATTFLLPSMPTRPVHDLPEFGPPISAAPIPSEDVAPGSIVRQSTWEATTGRSELTSKSVRKTWKLGELQLSGSGGHGYSVLPGDGSSAKAEFYSTQIAERPGWYTKSSSPTARWAGRTARWC